MYNITTFHISTKCYLIQESDNYFLIKKIKILHFFLIINTILAALRCVTIYLLRNFEKYLTSNLFWPRRTSYLISTKLSVQLSNNMDALTNTWNDI